MLAFLKLLCQVIVFQVFAEHLKWADVEGVIVFLHVLYKRLWRTGYGWWSAFWHTRIQHTLHKGTELFELL